MTSAASRTSRTVWWICLAAIAILFLNAASRAKGISDILVSGDGDDLVRLQQVRDWLAGQSWFDTTQYRILPPEGTSIHWSRYVDLGIAAFLVPASWVLAQPEAELAAIILWPTFLGCISVLVIGHATNRLLGPTAAFGALVTFLGWSKFQAEFGVGRIDHHNIQILCGIAIFYLSVLPGKPGLRGVLAGSLTAFSLAIGLEMLPFLAVLWAMMVLRHAFAEAAVGTWLIGFCLAFAGAAPALLIGQTPISGWWVNHCDVLAPPVLALAAVGIVATLVPVVLAKTLPHPVARIALALAITAVGLRLAAPLLLPCLAGPYAGNSAELRAAFGTLVAEALPAWILIQERPDLFIRILMPPVVLTVLALGATWFMRDRITRPIAMTLVQSFVVLLAGLAVTVLQIRAANLMTPAVPFLVGFLFHAFLAIPQGNLWRAPAALVVILAVPASGEYFGRTIAVAATGPSLWAQVARQSATDRSISMAHCRNRAAMAEVASLPKSTIFSSLKLGTAILASTPHAITSAGYHRKESGFWYGISAFESRENLRESLYDSRADFLVICVGVSQEVFINSLAETGWPGWLVEVTENRKKVRVFKVDRMALDREMGGP